MAANILVVDDDRLIRELISKTLRKDGHRVVALSKPFELALRIAGGFILPQAVPVSVINMTAASPAA